MKRGVILDGAALNPGDLSWEGLKSIASFDIYDRTPPECVLSRCMDKEIIITNKVSLSRDIISELKCLEYIGVTATGYNIIDVEACRDCNIAVTNIPSYSTEAVSQHVFALLLSITDQIGDYSSSVKRGEWEKSPDFCYYRSPMLSLKGKTFGVFGLGQIGRKVAEIAKAFSMNVIAYSPHSKAEGIENVDFESLLKRSDILSLHAPLTEKTEGIICQSSLDMMKSGAILINTARGALIDNDAVLASLNTGKLSWYLSDVFSAEPPRANDTLIHHPRAVFTPHVAWASLDTRQSLLSIAEENLKAFIAGKRLNRIV